MNSQHQIAELFAKYVANDCTTEEAFELITYIRSGKDRSFIESLIDQHLGEEAKEELMYQAASGRVFKKLDFNDTTIAPIVKISSRKFPAYLKVAAVVAGIIVSTLLLYNLVQPVKKDIVAAKTQDVQPGGNKATLVLSDGQQVILNDMQVGNIAQEGGAIIKKSADGQLAYTLTENTNKVNTVNTVKTPKGGQYQVILPDGSKVWLNSASSITYPAAFNTSERRVSLTGEGYFEITTMLKNKKKVPFIVESGKQKIEVLGTRFNVNAYDDESSIKTTLLEGKVKVMTENETVILKPNQQFNLLSEGITTRKVDVEQAIDWKNGDFIFADEDIKSIMRKIARWYNVEVVYENDIPHENLSGQISRDRNLSDVLRMLELSGDTKFKIENESIHISYKDK